MRIELVTEGGFAAMPGLARPVLLDAAGLSPEQSAELQRLVQAALAEKARQGPAKAKAAPIPDGRSYRITVQAEGEAGARKLIEAADPAVPPAFKALMEFARANGQR